MALCGFLAILVLVVPAPVSGGVLVNKRSRTPLVIAVVLAVVAVVAIAAVVLHGGGDDSDDAAPRPCHP